MRRGRPRARLLGDLEHGRNGPHRLRQPARAGRLLADAPARGRDRLVAEARRLAADPDLDEHRVGALERALELAGDRECAGESLPGEDPLGEPADHLSAGGIDVVERQLADVDPLALAHQPRHELGRVRRSGADHGELHPFTPVSVIPSTNAFWAKKKRTMTGAMNTIVPAITRFQLT